MPDDAPYRGYKSYSYLAPAEDYDVFDLDDELGRCPGYEPGLSAAEAERAGRLLRDSMVISLHDHPVVFPRDITRVRDYIRTGRQHTGYEGLSRSGLTAVFDNMMDGTGCVTSKSAWKWDDTIYDLGMRLCDIAHQDYVQVARTLADIISGADIFLGLSAGGVLTQTMVKAMGSRPLILALANPTPEILPEEVRAARDDAVIATGRSDYPNQVNNVLGFPYIFRGALDVRTEGVFESVTIHASNSSGSASAERTRLGPRFGLDLSEYFAKNLALVAGVEAAVFLPRVEIFVGGSEVNQLPPFNWGFISAVRYDFR